MALLSSTVTYARLAMPLTRLRLIGMLTQARLVSLVTQAGLVRLATVIVAMVIVATVCSVATQAAPRRFAEEDVKAAFVVNLAKFVTWPREVFADEKAALVIATVGDDKLYQAFSRLATTTCHGRSVRFVHAERPEMLPQCHVLFYTDEAMVETLEEELMTGAFPKRWRSIG